MKPMTEAPALPSPYLLFLGDVRESAFAKTAFGLRDWVPGRCLGELALDGCQVTTGLPHLLPSEAYAKGARALVIGVAPVGGQLAASWVASLVSALHAGLDIVSGLHAPLENVVELRHAAKHCGRRLIEVRRPPVGIPVGSGRKRTGKRLLTVGTDCALGKKYTALSIARAFAERGVPADFRATGQTGILIAGGGIPIDSVIADFIAGAAEILSPDAAPEHWDIIEGQGSIFHPAYAGVSLGLLHGSQPDVLVMCHTVGRQEVLGCPGFQLPSVEDAMALNLALARRVKPHVRCAGVSLNTSTLSADAAAETLDLLARQWGLPVADPIRGGDAFTALIDACLNGG
jgi:uncharacterized NAD-dependent epimerase/dehydratase family protein